jgi:hypothetical protein
MIRRALGVAALGVVAACSSGTGGTSPTTLPPTTRVPAPVTPTGVADRVRNWVADLGQGNDDAAYGLLGPGSQAAIGGRPGFAGVRADLVRTWGTWAKVQATYDALPLGDGRAVVVVHATAKDGSERAGALPMRVVGGAWFAEPLLDAGRPVPAPKDRSTIAPLPDLAVAVASGTTVTAFVDEQPADVAAPKAPRLGTVEVPYQPAAALRPGWHLVTIVVTRGDAVSASTVRYRVPDSK